jgi:hypothetical protein
MMPDMAPPVGFLGLLDSSGVASKRCASSYTDATTSRAPAACASAPAPIEPLERVVAPI